MTAITTLLAVALVLWSGGAAPGSDDPDQVELFKDDFSRLAPGLLSSPIGRLNATQIELRASGFVLRAWAVPPFLVPRGLWLGPRASCGLSGLVPRASRRGGRDRCGICLS